VRRPFVPFLALAAFLAAGAAAQAPSATDFRWEGLSRRNAGIVLFRSRWDPGVLELKDDLLRWTDRRDPGKNLVLPVQRLVRHELLCRGAPSACTEWRVSTRTETYVFRETPPAQGASLRRAFDALRGAYADIPSAETR
jgi:hypothetical protein